MAGQFGSRCPFVQGYNNLSSQIGLCRRLFRLSPDDVADQVAFSNAFYGGVSESLRPNTTKRRRAWLNA